MIVDIVNNSKRYDYIYDAIDWVSKELKINRRKNYVEIYITKKALTQYECDGFVSEIHKRGELKSFEVLINSKQSKKEIISTLFHEFVHIKQMLRNEFAMINESNYKWKGRNVQPSRYKLYSNLPWEKEAYMMEKLLYQKYINTSN